MINRDVPPIDYIEPELVRVQSLLADIVDLPDGVPSKIYKGRIWSDPYHKRILTHQEIYFPSVPELSDPDDCRFGVDFDLSFPVIFDAYKELAESSLRREGIRPNQENVLRRVQLFYKNMFETDDQQSKWKEEFWKENNSFFYVFCASKSNINPEFWKTHVSEYQGFVVEFDMQAIFNDIYANVSMGSNVDYYPRTAPNLAYHFPGGTNGHLREQLMVKLASSKYENFQFEDEFRLLRFDLTGHPLASPLSKTYQVPKKGITGIIFGEDISLDDERQIREACLQQDLKVTFSKAYRNGEPVRIEQIE